MTRNTAWEALHRYGQRAHVTTPPVPFEHDAHRAISLPGPFSVRRVQQ